MNFWASVPQRLLASVILDGEVKSDRASERHSLGVSSSEWIFVQNRSSVVSSSGWSTCWGGRGGGIAPGGPDSQGIFVARGGTAPERLPARFIYSYTKARDPPVILFRVAFTNSTLDAGASAARPTIMTPQEVEMIGSPPSDRLADSSVASNKQFTAIERQRSTFRPHSRA